MVIKKLLVGVAVTLLSSTLVLATENGSVTKEYIYTALKPNNAKAYRIYKEEYVKIGAIGVVPASSPEHKTYNTKDLVTAFSKNEISATNKFSGRKIRIKAKANEIGLNATGKGFISSGSWGQSIVMAVDKNDKQIQGMSAGETVDMICTVGNYTFKTVYLDECVPASEETVKIAIKRVEGFNFNTPDTLTAAVISAFYKSNEKHLESACLKSASYCRNEILKTTSDKIKPSAYKYAKEKNIYDWMKSLPNVQE